MSLNELFNLALRKQVGLCFQQKLVCFQQLSESINVWSLSIIGREFQIVSTAVVVNVFLTGVSGQRHISSRTKSKLLSLLTTVVGNRQ